MKILYTLTLFLFTTCLFNDSAMAQDNSTIVRNANEDDASYRSKPLPEEKGFKKERLFTGGGFTAMFGSYGSAFGVSPVIGYQLNDYVDAGIILNYNYNGGKDLWENNDKYRRHIYGPGAFVRAYPVSFLFLQAQFEQNFTNEKYIPASRSAATGKYNANAPSLLLGGGYTTGRIKGGSTFFYVSILADVLKKWDSPYVDRYIDNGKRKTKISPIISAGVNVGLFQGRYGRY